MATDNALLISLLVGSILIILVLIIFISCWFLRKRRNYTEIQPILGYSANKNTATVGATNSSKAITSRPSPTDDHSIILTCQFYLRTTEEYQFHSQLSQLGSNKSKNWFLLTQTSKTSTLSSNNGTHILTIQPKSDKLNQLNDEDSAITYMKSLNSLLKRLFHPYIEPINKLDILYAQKLIVVIRPYQRLGSLKDLIQDVMPTIFYEAKYSNKNSGLSLERVRMYSLQILEGLIFLQSKSMPPMVDLHSGNIIVTGSSVQIGSYEYQFLEQRSRIYSFARRATSSVTLADGMTRAQACEILCFGGIVFEMLTGYELGENLRGLTPKNWHDCGRDPNARDMLSRLFNMQQSILTLKQIRELPYFSNNTSQLKELQNFKVVPGDYSNDVKNLLEQWDGTMKKKRGTTPRTSAIDKRPTNTVQQEKPAPMSIINLNYTPTIPPPSTTSSKVSSPPPPSPSTQTSSHPPPHPPTTPVVSQVSTPPPPAPAPPPPPPPPPVAAAAPPAPAPPPPSSGDSGDRSALLENIRLGTKLKKTVTNDRSRPKFK